MKEATLNKKIEQIQEVANKFEGAQSVVFVDYLGLTVEQVSDLRNRLYKEGCEMKVAKNNILRRAAKQVGFEGLDDFLVGPSAAAYTNGSANIAKIMYDFAKTNDVLKVKAGVVDGNVMNAKELKVYSSLPNKEGMIAMLLSVLQAPIRNMACVVKAVSEQKEN